MPTKKQLVAMVEELNMSVAFWEEKCDHRKERNKELKEENEKFEEAMKDALSCSKLINDFMNKTKGFTEWATPDDCDGDVVDYAIYLEKQIPDKKGKKLSQKDKELLLEIDDHITWGDGDRWIDRRNLLERLMK